MPPSIVQSAAYGSGGVWLGDILTAPFNNNLAGGNALVGFACARGPGYPPCTSFMISNIVDSQSNTWNNLAVDNSSGNAIYGLGYALSSDAGADTVTFTGTGFCGFTYDPCALVVEVAGVTSYGSLAVTSGNDTVAAGSITTPQGTYSFSSTTVFPYWYLNLMYLAGSNSGIVLAFVYTSTGSFEEDSIAGWSFVNNNEHSGLYTVVTPGPAPVRIWISVGNTKHIGLS
jgi:hypothetical protein